MKIGIVSDTSGNIAALQAAIGEMDKAGVGIKIHLGNIVGNCPFPTDSIAKVFEEFKIIIRGKQEINLCKKESYGLKQNEEFVKSINKSILEKSGVADEYLDILGSLLDYNDNINIDGISISVCNLSVESPVSSLRASSVDSNPHTLSGLFTTQIVFTGSENSSGSLINKYADGRISQVREIKGNRENIQYLQVEGEKSIITVGSNGNTNLSKFAIFDTTDKSLLFYNIAYDSSKVVHKMQRLKYPNSSIMRILDGK